MFETHKANRPASLGGVTPMQPVSNLFLQGFGQQQVALLVQARARFIEGNLSEWAATNENHKRLLFTLWLVEHGKLRES